MDDSPRSSKRRRLDGTTEQSSPLSTTATPMKTPNGSLKRPTRGAGLRKSSGRAQKLEDPSQESGGPGATPSSAPRGRPRGRPRKSEATPIKKVVDVYDDIDGALAAGSSPKSARKRAVATASNETPQMEETPKRKPGRPRKIRPEALDQEADILGSTAATTVAKTGSARKGRVSELRATPASTKKKEKSLQETLDSQKTTIGGRPSESADELGVTPTITVVDVDSPSRGPKRAYKKRTPKVQAAEDVSKSLANDQSLTPKKKRGRPPKRVAPEPEADVLGVIEDEDYPDGKASDVNSTWLSRSTPQTAPNPAIVIDRPVNGHHTTNGESVVIDQSPLPKADMTELDLLKKIVLEKVTKERPIPLVGLDEEYKKVYQLVEQTVLAGEGNSMLVIGARGSGKSSLVNKVLDELSKDHRGDFHIVKLNGFIHTDDKLALREIWRQLGKEMEVEDTVGKNYADTLTTLLALLSHPPEADGQESDQVAKSVVFIMDEFEQFAAHPRQTLLYNLFDIAQSRKAPIAVLGVTTRVDVVDSLEKRVKSRFSHRYVHVSFARSFGAFRDICKTALMVTEDELVPEEKTRLVEGQASGVSGGKSSGSENNILTVWNMAMERLFEHPDFTKSVLGPVYHRTKSVPTVLTSALLPLSNLTEETFPLTAKEFQLSLQALRAPDSKLYLLPSLSELQLALLIAAARLDIILDTDTCNFNMAYAEYVSLAGKARVQSAAGGAIATGAVAKVWGREVARGEWERLLELELVMPVAGAVGGSNAMVRVDVGLEEISPSVPEMDRVMEKWCRTI